MGIACCRSRQPKVVVLLCKENNKKLNMKYDSYFNNQGSMGWQDCLLLPYLLLMIIYAALIWCVLTVTRIRPKEEVQPKNNNKMPVIAYIISAAVWVIFLYVLFVDLMNMN